MEMRPSQTKLILIELIIIILFFSIAGAICINVFAQAQVVSTKSTDTTMATLVAQTAAETIRSSDDGAELLAEQYSKTDDGYIAYFDAAWDTVEEAAAVYQMHIRISENEGMRSADITVNKTDREIFAVNVKRVLGTGEYGA